jgi:hypothetical protein
MILLPMLLLRWPLPSPAKSHSMNIATQNQYCSAPDNRLTAAKVSVALTSHTLLSSACTLERPTEL